MAQSQPISVLRKSGSFVSLQQQKSHDSTSFLLGLGVVSPDPGAVVQESDQRKTKVTIINTNALPNYSTERYYMLSEIQLKSHSIIFLRDLFPTGADENEDDGTENTADTNLSASSSASMDETTGPSSNIGHENDNIETRTGANLPPYIILYLLWRPDSEHFDNPTAYAKRTIKPAIDQIISLHKASKEYQEDSSKPSPPIYLSVDRLAIIDPSMKEQADAVAEYKKEQIHLSEELVRVVANATDQEMDLRSHVEGMSVGLSSDFRAAPGLETCMDSIVVGHAERRHYKRPKNMKVNSMTIIRNGRDLDPSRSCIGIVTEYPDDLTGLDPLGETDAVQNLKLHSRSIGNWSGKGNVLSFAARSQKLWRKIWDYSPPTMNGNELKSVGNPYNILSRRKNRANQDVYLPSERLRQNVERSADLMVYGFFSFLLAFAWKNYSDEICENVQIFLKALEKFR